MLCLILIQMSLVVCLHSIFGCHAIQFFVPWNIIIPGSCYTAHEHYFFDEAFWLSCLVWIVFCQKMKYLCDFAHEKLFFIYAHHVVQTLKSSLCDCFWDGLRCNKLHPYYFVFGSYGFNWVCVTHVDRDGLRTQDLTQRRSDLTFC